MNFFGDITLILSLGKGCCTGAGAEPPASPPWYDMSSESLLLLELSGSPAGTATGPLLDDPFSGEAGNLPGVVIALFASSVADFARSHCTLVSLASYLGASSIANCAFAGALINRPCLSLACVG